MRPDDGTVPFDGTAAGGDPELAALVDRLTFAGDRARSLEGAPRPAFAAGLRARLLDAAPADDERTGAYVALAPLRPERAAADRFPVRAVQPRLIVRVPTILPAPRWTALAVAAALILSVAGLNADRWLSGPTNTRAGDVAGATLVRGGYATALTAGAELQEGDVIRTDLDGRATLELGGGIARLSEVTTVRLVTLESDVVAIDQLQGRVYHRVTGPSVTYEVATAGLAWAADGTAFDVRREPDPAGGEQARVVAVEHDITLRGPGLEAGLDEGDIAIVHLGETPAGSSTAVSIGRVTPADLADPWLLANARRDVAAGFEPGIFAALLAALEPTPTASPSEVLVEPDAPTGAPTDPAEPSVTPTEPPATTRPAITPGPTPDPTPKPTPKPTPRPTPKPTPKPTATPQPMGSLSLAATACPGRFTVLAWSKAGAAGFHHYQTIRSTSSSIPATYPPAPPAVAPNGLYGTDRAWLSAVDPDLDGSSVSYRTMAFTAGDDPYATSAVKTVSVKPVKALGPLGAVFDEGKVFFDWDAFGGPGTCFTWYKIVVSTTDETPDYLDGDTQVWVGEDQATSSALVDPMDPGTYHARLQVLRSSESGTILVAETDPVTFDVP